MTVKPSAEPGRRKRRGGGAFSPHYVDFFERFNSGEYFEAHEVLELLWLVERGWANGDFFKGLIQVAGAFVHIRKRRRGPAIALLKLAQANLRLYPSIHLGLNVNALLDALAGCQQKLESGSDGSFPDAPAPRLRLLLEERPKANVKYPGCFERKFVR